MKGFVAKLLALGPGGLLALSLLDSAGVPLYPGPDLLIVVLASQQPALGYVYALLASGGSLVGALILFFLARRGGQIYLDRKTASGRGAQLRHWFQHYGLVTVFVPALVPLVPLPMKIFVLCAGALSTSPFAFALVVLLARLPRYFALAYLGAHLGPGSWDYLKQHAGWLLFGAVVLIVGLLGLIRTIDQIKARQQRRRTTAGLV